MTNDALMGDEKKAIVTQRGNVWVGGNLLIRSKSDISEYSYSPLVAGTSLEVVGRMEVGSSNASGYFFMGTGTDVTVRSHLKVLATHLFSWSTFEMGGGSLYVSGTEYVGFGWQEGGPGPATFKQHSGVHTVGAELRVASGGSLELNGGSLTVEGRIDANYGMVLEEEGEGLMAGGGGAGLLSPGQDVADYVLDMEVMPEESGKADHAPIMNGPQFFESRISCASPASQQTPVVIIGNPSPRRKCPALR